MVSRRSTPRGHRAPRIPKQVLVVAVTCVALAPACGARTGLPLDPAGGPETTSASIPPSRSSSTTSVTHATTTGNSSVPFPGPNEDLQVSGCVGGVTGELACPAVPYYDMFVGHSPSCFYTACVTYNTDCTTCTCGDAGTWECVAGRLQAGLRAAGGGGLESPEFQQCGVRRRRHMHPEPAISAARLLLGPGPKHGLFWARGSDVLFAVS
jgi:hypothetical protein